MANNSYWFFLEPYVYVSIKDGKILIYNTFDANHIVVDNEKICKLIKDIYAPESGGVVSITSDQLETDTDIRKFVYDVRRYFMGDIIDSRISNIKPTQPLPILNIQAELLKTESKEYVGDGIATNLRSLVIYTNGRIIHNNEKVANYFKQIAFPCSGYDTQIPVESLLSFLRWSEAIGASAVQLMGGNIFEYDGFDTLMQDLSGMKMEFTIGVQYQDVNKMAISKITANNVNLTIFADLPLDLLQFNRMLDIVNNSHLPYKISFAVTGIDDIEKAESIIANQGIEKYELLPVYTGNNYDFFKDTIFLSEEDILENPIPMQKIFSNQVINSIFWGNLTITPDCKVYANLNMESIGKITDSMHEILFEEITKGNAWKMIRSKTPCCDCVYQWLCPSPSNYEIAIGKHNLCLLAHD